MKYFVTAEKRMEDIARRYVEFQKECPVNVIFDNESVYLLYEDYENTGFCKFLCDCVYKFDLFDLDTITAEEWQEIHSEALVLGGIIEEMAEELQQWAQPLFATGVNRISLEIESVYTQENTAQPRVQAQLPNVKIPDGYNEETYFKYLCRKGMTTRYGSDITKEADERLEKEIAVIHQLKLERYFIMLSGYVNFAHASGITIGAGVGAAPGSLVCFVLGITDVEPIKYGLCFERFISPERTVVPDIDFEISAEHIGSTTEYFNKNYHICRFIKEERYTAVSALAEAAVNADLPESQTAEITEILSRNDFSIEIAMFMFDRLGELYESDSAVREVLDNAKKLEGTVKSVSTDSRGFVVLPDNTAECPPVEMCNGVERIAYTQRELEKLGLVVLDFIPFEPLPESDKDLILRELKSSCFEDMIFTSAMYLTERSDFLQLTERPIISDCRELNDILSVSRGCIVYQEQILDILHILGGFDYNEAETIRRHLANRNEAGTEKARYGFVRNCINNGFDSDSAMSIFKAMCEAAPYVFNKSHEAGIAANLCLSAE